ncbi:hypothetical protein BKA83DRAFT_4516110 [Pisolithus microcarpus]|nr:hypothetical protein BKA83DRAFT_4516110 [Pisolithus microcarpus]
MGSTGSGRSNFIDNLAEPEGARAPHGVGSRTRDIREHADSVRHSEAKNHKADPAMLEEAHKVTGVLVWHLKYFCPGSGFMSSAKRDASTGTRIDRELVTYPASDRIVVSCDQIGVIGQLWDPIVIERLGGRSVTVRDLPAGIYAFFQMHLTRVEEGDPARRHGLHPGGARKLYSTLAKLPHPHFIHRRLKLSSIAYRVTEVKLLPDPSATHEVHTAPLMPLVVTLPICLEEDRDPSTSPLLRPWLPKWAENEADATWELLEQFEQPFNALLPQRLPYNHRPRSGFNQYY